MLSGPIQSMEEWPPGGMIWLFWWRGPPVHSCISYSSGGPILRNFMSHMVVLVLLGEPVEDVGHTKYGCNCNAPVTGSIIQVWHWGCQQGWQGDVHCRHLSSQALSSVSSGWFGVRLIPSSSHQWGPETSIMLTKFGDMACMLSRVQCASSDLQTRVMPPWLAGAWGIRCKDCVARAMLGILPFAQFGFCQNGNASVQVWHCLEGPPGGRSLLWLTQICMLWSWWGMLEGLGLSSSWSFCHLVLL